MTFSGGLSKISASCRESTSSIRFETPSLRQLGLLAAARSAFKCARIASSPWCIWTTPFATWFYGDNHAHLRKPVYQLRHTPAHPPFRLIQRRPELFDGRASEQDTVRYDRASLKGNWRLFEIPSAKAASGRHQRNRVPKSQKLCYF